MPERLCTVCPSLSPDSCTPAQPTSSGNSSGQLLWVIFWSALVTYILMKLIGLVLHGTRYSDEILEVGDLAIHDEEAFPEGISAEDARRHGGGPRRAGLDEGMPPDPGLAPSTHPDAGET